MAEKVTQLKRGQQVAFWATLITLFISLLKGIIGVLFDSKVLVADAFHSAADTIAIFASGFGLWLAARKKSLRFPYGLYKAETLLTAVIGILIIWAGIELILDGYQKLFFIAQANEFPTLPVIASISSIVVAYFIARKEKQIGKAINSQSLLANASESFLDIFSSIVVLLGILMTYWRIPYVEGAVIILIALMILKLGLENFWNSLLILLDANLDENLQKQIEQTVQEIPGVTDVKDLKIRQAGPFRMVELKFTTNPSISIYQAHAVADEIEHKIHQHYSTVESVLVHAEPSRKATLRAVFPVTEINGIESKVYGHFGRAPYFAIVNIQENQIEIEDFYLNEFLDREKHIGLHVVKVLVNYDLDMLFTNRLGEISFSLLRENFIDIYQIETDDLTIHHVIQLYLHNKLHRITVATHSVDESLSEND